MAVHAAELRFDMADPQSAAAVAGALAVEADEGPEGSRARVWPEGASVHVRVEAGTVSDLRAALNSVVRLLDVADRTAGTAPTGTPGGALSGRRRQTL
jgi:tRNA threonylcarbamoyladenosine modification (KEOPS) complex  Pcc1 subunit